ncbi:MAG: alpha/beta hydrolase [Chloroflexi bacterium]|nr:alpha/beta hydrolase [Chloroflexota bacterium]
MAFEERQVEAGGFSIRYWEAGQGRPVVMLDCTGWRGTIVHDALAEKYQVFSLELPGAGDSPANTASQSVGDLAATIAKAASALTSERYTLIGTSFGAHVALWQAIQSPDQVEALILVSPTAILPQELPAGATAQDVHQMMFAHPENAEKHAPSPPEIFAKESELARRLNSGVHDGEAEAKLGDIHCPTLAVFGQEDRLVSLEAPRVYREKIPNCNIALVYDAGHCIIGDRPEALLNTVLDYAEHWETFIVGHQTGIINP